ncbi:MULTISPECIES: hypothetical protein [Cysteiniphilum]|uniref:hypothetical protein n=1 Tax=Cysteiniphilum TaxID=2056696 RepID=UPI00177AC230|nr:MULTISPECIES: hypothetical protein [Cysteiniphilum]
MADFNSTSSFNNAVGAGGRNQQANKVSLADFGRFKKIRNENSSCQSPSIIVLSSSTSRHTAILRYIFTGLFPSQAQKITLFFPLAILDFVKSGIISLNIIRTYRASHAFMFYLSLNKNREFSLSQITYLQNYLVVVVLALSELRSRLGLRNPIILGLYCTVIRNISESKCALLTALTSYSIMAHCYGRVGAEYNSCLTVNNARRLGLCGFLTTRSPKLTTTKVSLWNA